MRPVIWKLILCLSFVLCFVWYAKEHFYRDPGSAFYDEENAFEQRYSQHRKGEVDEFVQSKVASTPGEETISGPRPALCAAFSSVQRKNTQYLEVRVLTTTLSILC